jgi:hypothetical protein
VHSTALYDYNISYETSKRILEEKIKKDSVIIAEFDGEAVSLGCA